MQEFDVESTLGYLLSKAHQSMKNRFVSMLKSNHLDITVEQWAVLNIVCALPGVSQSDIARMTQTDKANVMRMIDLMEKKEFVERLADQADRRVHRIHATPRGEEMLNAVIPVAREANRQSEAGLSPQECELLKEMLRRIRANADTAPQISKP